jgi:hypothetical protein
MNAAAQTALPLADTRPTIDDAFAEAEYAVNAIARLAGEGGALDLIEEVARRLPPSARRADIEGDARRLTELLEEAEKVARELLASVSGAIPRDIASAVLLACEARQ